MQEVESIVRVRTISLDGEFSIDIVRKGRMVAIRYEDDRDTEIAFESTAIEDIVRALLDFKHEIRELDGDAG